MKILTSGRSRRVSAARASISWRERVLAVNSTTPWLLIVRCQPTQGGPLSQRSVTLGRLITRSPEPPAAPRHPLGRRLPHRRHAAGLPVRQQRRQPLLHPSPLFDFTVESRAEVAASCAAIVRSRSSRTPCNARIASL